MAKADTEQMPAGWLCLKNSVLVATTMACLVHGTLFAASPPSSPTFEVHAGVHILDVPRAYMGATAASFRGPSFYYPSLLSAGASPPGPWAFWPARTPETVFGYEKLREHSAERVVATSLCNYDEGQEIDHCGPGPDQGLNMAMWFANPSRPLYPVPTAEMMPLVSAAVPTRRRFDPLRDTGTATFSVFGTQDCADGLCRIHYLYTCDVHPPDKDYRLCRGPFTDSASGVRGIVRFIYLGEEDAENIINAIVARVRTWEKDTK